MITFAQDQVVSGISKSVESLGTIGAFIAVVVVALIVMWRFILKEFLGSVITITGNVKETMVATKETAECNREHGVTLLAAIDMSRQHTEDLRRIVNSEREVSRAVGG